MGIREALNKKKGPAMGAAMLAVCAALMLIVWESRSTTAARVTKVFYSSDDGQTWFADDADKLFPFDHNGQQAYRVDVYKTSDGKEFAADILRYTDSAKSQLAELRSQANPDQMRMANIANSGLEIKRPGDTKWCRKNSPQGDAILAIPTAPDGSPDLGVMP